MLYRRLRELGIRAYVSAPECLEQGKRKHNKLDARKLASRLYSYVQGDSEMLRVVRVPTPDQERLRAQSRQHDQLVATRKAIEPIIKNPQPALQSGKFILASADAASPIAIGKP